MLRTADEDADVQLQEQVQRAQRRLQAKLQDAQTFEAEAGMIRNKFSSIQKQTLTYQSQKTACDNLIEQLQ